ncbi:hypothetical protein D915_007881 [Fasciola hepatica]|uniref:Uncharacterized protein n=1 Tax=Fasciola hepatica TaxID=6192 RepID=A0A4E0R457_FASHE|nr:hypothetical protein D915_007881 [Fasciola hepatica]
MTGLAFEIELEIEQNPWEFQVTTDENHYSAWSPTCRKFIEATAMVNEVIRNNLIGCRSNETGTKTQMTIYMALSPTDLTAESFTPCKTNYFTQWKIAISKNFKIHTDNVHFLPITRSVNLQAMRILANVEKATGLVTSSDLLSEEDKMDMKVFLTRWMQFMDERDKLIGFRISFHGDAAAAVDVGLLFDVTNQTELNMIKTVKELSHKAKRYPGPVKLTECELTKATYKKFTNCDNENRRFFRIQYIS